MAGPNAGTLSIAIVADIARLQTELNTAKRQVAAASADIGKSARHANDNLAGMGTAMGGVNRMSRSMSANFLNLSRQGQDVATMFAMGANPMQIFTSQAAQIADVLGQIKREANETGTSLTAMTMRGLGKIGPYALAAAAAAGVLAAALQTVTDEINETSEVTVTWQDTALGAFDMVADYLSGVVTDAFNALGLDVGKVWDFIVSGVTNAGNMIIGTFVASQRAILAAWQTFPGAFADLIITGVNAAIQGLEDFVNGSIALVNSFSSKVGIEGIDNVSFGQITNRWAGQAGAAGGTIAGEFASGFQDYFGEFAGAVSPFAQARAQARMNADAESAGTAAGQRAGAAAAEALAAEVAQALADLDAAAKAAAMEAVAAQNKTKTYADNLRRKTDEEIAAREEIEQTARELEEARIKDNAYLFETLFTDGIGGVWDIFERQGIEAISRVAGEWATSMASGQGGTGGGGIGGLFNSLGAAASANPVGMYVAATKFSNMLGKGVSKALGINYNEKVGAIGGMLPGIIAGVFMSTKYGTANVTGAGAMGITSKGKGRADGASDLGGGVQSALQGIAAALGVSVGSYNVSIGSYKDSFRVSGSGKTGKLKGGDVQDFGDDSAAAVAFAITDALKDGAILASDSIRNLLGKGSDLQEQIDKAITFKSVFDALLEATDPVAAAMAEIGKQAAELRKIFDEAGASAAEYADLEKLLGIKRQEAIDAARASKLDELTETFGLQIRMLELMGKSEESLTAARILEVAGMKAALQPLQAMVYELEDARGVIEKFGPLGDSLRAFREELLGQAGGGGFAGITARFRNTAGNAAIGDASALAAFQGDASAYLEAAKANAGSALEYQRALSEVLTGADKGIFAADTQVQMAQLQIDAIANQTNVLQQMRTEIREANVQIAGNSGALLRLFQRFEGEGMLVRTDADTPLAVTTP